MKKITKLLLIIMVLSSINLIKGQTWINHINKKNPTFYNIQKAFINNYNKENDVRESGGIKDGDFEKYKRWEWYWEQRVGKSGKFPSSDVLMKESNLYNKTHSGQLPQDKKSGNKTWSFMGPASSLGGYGGIGRINCIAFHPTDINTFWVGSPSGGLWKTTNGGNTWSTNTDDLPVLGISDIAIDKTNPDILYIGTGDGDTPMNLCIGFGETKSIGVLKSSDGGISWNATGLIWKPDSLKSIRRVMLNPDNPQILLVAASDGIWRTIDGGTTWSNMQPGWFMDMEFKPGDPNYVYATTFNMMGNAQIFTSQDNGITWKQVTNFSEYNRIKLGVSANNDKEVDALCSGSKNNGLGGIWVSNDNGATFSQQINGDCTNNMLGYTADASGCGGNGYYDLSFAVNPNNYLEKWLGGVNTWKTVNGGNNWNLNNIWTANYSTAVPEVHADKHYLTYDPLDNNLIFECNDGGLYKTNNGGTDWIDLTNGMGISQIYRIGTSATVANHVICGLQDNGSKELNYGIWNDRTGGDGFECIIDNTNENTQYSSYYMGVINRTYDAWSDFTDISYNNFEMLNSIYTYGYGAGSWITPYVMDPQDHNVLYVGYHDVWKSTDQGDSWTALSNFGLASNPYIRNNPLQSLSVAPSNPQTIYTATYDSLFITHDGGNTWHIADTALLPKDYMTYIAVKNSDENTLWLTFSGFDAGQKVYKSTDGGTSWTNISGTLPNVPVNCIVYQKNSKDGLYIGTDIGVFYTDSTMTDWIAFNSGLPNAVVTELEISYVNKKLWAGTYGRGLWNSNLYNDNNGINENNISNSFTIYPNPNKGQFILQTTLDNQKPYDISIFNVLCEKVWEVKKSTSFQNKIDLGSLNEGVYFINFTVDKTTVVKKIVIIK